MRRAVAAIAVAAIAATVGGAAGGAEGRPGPERPPPRGSADVTVRHPAADTIEVRDDRGRVLRFATPPRRIVSLIPALTELLFAVDAGDRLVGRTRYGDRPAGARSVPSVGEGVRPSLESVMARSPDLVVLYRGVGNRRIPDRLEELGVPVMAVRHDGFEDLERNLERLGRLTGREEEARAVRRRIRCQLAAVARTVAGRPRVPVFYEVWGDPPVTVAGGSYLDSLLTIAGGRNVFGDLDAPSPTVGLEAILARGPEVIVRAEGRSGGAPPPAERPGWDALEAVRSGRVRAVDGDLVHRLGPRVGRAAAALATAIHPELAGALTWDRIAPACRSARRRGEERSGR